MENNKPQGFGKQSHLDKGQKNMMLKCRRVDPRDI